MRADFHSPSLQVYVLAYLRDLLQWLSSWPMGIKLNDEIATLICRAFLGLSNLWEHGESFLPYFVRSRESLQIPIQPA